jgi:superfamily II DNA helicase RecQ
MTGVVDVSGETKIDANIVQGLAKATSAPMKQKTEFGRIHALRSSMKASEQHVAPYIILQQKALHSIATNMPRTIAELKRQLGVGAKTVERYGAELLEIVNDYANNNI